MFRKVVLVAVLLLLVSGLVYADAIPVASKSSSPPKVVEELPVFYDDESKAGLNDLWVRLEVPKNLPSSGGKFNVEVYIQPRVTHIPGDLILTLVPSGNGNVAKFAGLGTHNPSVGNSFHNIVKVKEVNPKTGSITIGWEDTKFGLLDTSPSHLASLQMEVKGSGSFQIEVIKTAPESEVKYYSGTGGWICPAPTLEPSKINCQASGVDKEDFRCSQSSCDVDEPDFISCSCAASTNIKVNPKRVVEFEGKSLVAYTLKQGNTRVIRNTQCIPNLNPCLKKDCGSVDDGCGGIVTCTPPPPNEFDQGEVCVNNIIQPAISQLVPIEKELCEAVIPVSSPADRMILVGISNAFQGKNVDAQPLPGCPGMNCKSFQLNVIINALIAWFNSDPETESEIEPGPDAPT